METSLVFLGDRQMRALNKKWRGKDAQTNVLAFSLTADVGEIIINPYQATREAREMGISYTKRVVFLFVHGLLHLYGYDHETEKEAKKMTRKENIIIQSVKRKVKD